MPHKVTFEIELKRDLQANKVRENMQVENIHTVGVKVWRYGQYLGISMSFNRAGVSIRQEQKKRQKGELVA